MRRAPISHADLLLALDALGARDDASVAMIAAALGFTPPAVVADEARADVAPPTELPKQEAEDQAPPSEAPTALPRQIVPAPAHAGFALEGPRPYKAPTLTWLHTAKPLAGPASSTIAAADPMPLLVPRWTRNILATLLATRQADGPLDLDRIVRNIASQEWTVRLPRVPRDAPRGVQLLVDVSDAMTPFAADQRRLTQALRRLLGPDRMSKLEFSSSPLQRLIDPATEDWREYREGDYPPNRTPVLALTDLGIGRPPLSAPRASVDDWIRFARQLAGRGSPLIALVPYGESRWPDRLRRALHIVTWDRATTVGAVRFRRTGA